MTSLLQISDTHFGTERHDVVEALVKLAHSQRPDLAVLSGDITQRAQVEEFSKARAFTDRLGLPLLAIPGNHDIPLLDLFERIVRPYARHRQAFGADLEPEHHSPKLMVLCLNTTRARRHKHGEVSNAQIERTAKRLATATAGQLRIVVVHQPVAATQAADQVNLLRGHAAALRRWSAAGADIVMGGHIHLPYVLPLAPTPRRLWAVQAGTAVSARVRNGVSNSVNLLRWGEPQQPHGQCRVERWDHDARVGAFVQHSTTDLQVERPDVR